MKKFINALECNLRDFREVVWAWDEHWWYVTDDCCHLCDIAWEFETCQRELIIQDHELNCEDSILIRCDDWKNHWFVACHWLEIRIHICLRNQTMYVEFRSENVNNNWYEVVEILWRHVDVTRWHILRFESCIHQTWEHRLSAHYCDESEMCKRVDCW